jgi:hypothetical protein
MTLGLQQEVAGYPGVVAVPNPTSRAAALGYAFEA